MKYNTIIIGAGISGCSIAYHLAKAGMKDILVIDKGYLTNGATGRCGAGIRQQWATEANCILAKRSIDFFETATSELQYHGDIEFKQEGYLILSTSKEEDEQFAKNVRLQNSLGIPAKQCSVDEALEIVPYLNKNAFTSATFCPTDGHLNPFKMTEAFYLAAKNLGVKFHFFEEVIDIVTIDGAVESVTTNKNNYKTINICNAAGGYAKEIGDLAGVDIPVYSENHEILVTEPIEKMQGPMVMSFSHNLYCQQVPHGSFIMGRTTPSQPHDHNIGSSWQFLDEMAKTICHVAPLISSLRVVRQWGGSYNNSPDRQPIISKTNVLAGFYMACGFSGHGFMFSPMTGEVMTEIILGLPPTVDHFLYSIERFETQTQATVESSVV